MKQDSSFLFLIALNTISMYNNIGCDAMNKIYGLILTLIVGLFFLIGGVISKKIKNKEKLNIFSVSLAFIIMLNLIFFDLMPEVIELLEDYKTITRIILIIVFVILGILLLKILDFFIPDHHHDHHDNEKNIDEHISHEHHIGTLTMISLTLHNILEGFTIYSLSLNDIKVGLLICLSVALHNIPLGMQIFSGVDTKKQKGLIILLTISSLIGGLLYLLIGEVSPLVEGIITCITLGMIIYIAIFELLPEMKHHIKEKESIFGLLVGLIIVVISLLIE